MKTKYHSLKTILNFTGSMLFVLALMLLIPLILAVFEKNAKTILGFSTAIFMSITLGIIFRVCFQGEFPIAFMPCLYVVSAGFYFLS